MVFATNQKAYARWSMANEAPRGRALVGSALEKRVMTLAVTAKRLVAMPGETPRRLTRPQPRKPRTVPA